MGQDLEALGFPTSFPAGSFAAVMKLARGGVTRDERRELALHVWIVAGWLLNAAFEREMFGAEEGGQEETAPQEQEGESEVEADEECLPLMILVPIAIELVKWWLGRREK